MSQTVLKKNTCSLEKRRRENGMFIKREDNLFITERISIVIQVQKQSISDHSFIP